MIALNKARQVLHRIAVKNIRQIVWPQHKIRQLRPVVHAVIGVYTGINPLAPDLTQQLRCLLPWDQGLHQGTIVHEVHEHCAV